MNNEEYLLAKDTLLTEYEQRSLVKYGLDHVVDKLLYHQSKLQKRNEQLENKLDEFHQDLNNANIAQANLLPKKITFAKELNFSARFIPSQYISGDTYNIFRLDEDHVGLYQIDVSGHGVTAALFSVSLSQMLNVNTSHNNLLKTSLKKPPYYKINSPVKVMSLLNEEQFFAKHEIFFTMVYMIINVKTGEMEYTRAGHNPPVILRKNGVVDQPLGGSIPIGWDFERDDTVIKIKLHKGDRIFLFSDGILEAQNVDKDLFGEERLFNVLKSNLANNLDTTLNDTIIHLSQYTGSLKFEDDISILGVTYLG